MLVEARCDIAARPETVWAVLTDARALVSEGLGITRIDGTIEADHTFKLWAEISGKRAFKLRVTQFTPARRMTWRGGMPLGLFTGTRQFHLTPSAMGTDLHMREEFTGLMKGLITRSMPDLQPSFEAFVTGVKAAAERREI